MFAVSTATPLFEYDLDLCGGTGEMAGADEAGRGCFAGPLVTAAVVFDYSRFKTSFCQDLLEGLRDSKKMTKAARERLYPLIVRCASRFSLVVSCARTIDANGIHKTNLKDLDRCLKQLSPCPELVLIDGWQLVESSIPHRPVKGGDSLSACIAAASVIAKVTRDRLMRRLHLLYPGYGFNQHVGYGTKAHRQAIARLGYCALHRRSFKINSIISKGGQSGRRQDESEHRQDESERRQDEGGPGSR
jgi:ribonuclease HII